MSVFKTVAKVSDIKDGEIKEFSIEGRSLAIANVGGEFFAFDNLCTHAECSLAGGTLSDHNVICWCHGSQFDVRTGEVRTPPAEKPLTVYKTKLEGSDLLVEI